MELLHASVGDLGYVEVASWSTLAPVHIERPPRICKGYPGGAVTFHAIIGKDGSVVRLDIRPGDNPGMFRPGVFPLLQGRGAQEIADKVRQWRYEPAFVDGYPVEVDTTVTVRFSPGG